MLKCSFISRQTSSLHTMGFKSLSVLLVVCLCLHTAEGNYRQQIRRFLDFWSRYNLIGAPKHYFFGGSDRHRFWGDDSIPVRARRDHPLDLIRPGNPLEQPDE